MPKSRIMQHSKPKDYRPISLTYFALKTMEKLVNRYIKEEPLAAHPLHDRQYTYQTGKSVVTALIEAVSFVKKGMKNKGMVLAGLLDVHGAFNHTTKESIVKGAQSHLVSNTVSGWLWRMLICRRVEAHWGPHSEEVKVANGCPQGVLSPSMWYLVIDELIRLPNEAGFFAQAYAGGILVPVKADDEHVFPGLMQHALGIVHKWC